MKKLLRFLVLGALALACGCLVAVAALELWVACVAGPCKVRQMDEIYEPRVGLVLGCSPRLRNGHRNYYFLGRMEAAAQLWKAGKLSCIIASGDNKHRSYNEPVAMKAALVALGVPANKIICDYAGFRTLDSVVRAKEIFGAEKICIISQDAHARRASVIARYKDIDTLYYPAPVKADTQWMQVLRERGARFSMLRDLLTDRQPHHLGEQLPLPL